MLMVKNINQKDNSPKSFIDLISKSFYQKILLHCKCNNFEPIKCKCLIFISLRQSFNASCRIRTCDPLLRAVALSAELRKLEVFLS